MRQAIVTKYLGPTDARGSRVKAICDAGSITLSWDHAMDPQGNHRAAATALANKYGWLTRGVKLVGGGMPQATPYAYAFVMISAGEV